MVEPYLHPTLRLYGAHRDHDITTLSASCLELSRRREQDARDVFELSRESRHCVGRDLRPGLPHLGGGTVRVPLCVCLRRSAAGVREHVPGVIRTAPFMT